MTTENTAATVAAATAAKSAKKGKKSQAAKVAAAVAAPVKKTTKKVEKTVATKKGAKKTATPATPEKKERAKKSGLRKAQERIVIALAKGGSLSRAELAEKAQVDQAGCVEWIGSSDPEVRAKNDEKHFPSLISLGLVKIDPAPSGKGAVYTITGQGRAAAAKLTR